ncbi:MAG: sulfatase [Myxococcota bacterium]|jgi:arylsulfatase A-like enzyme|nr:sulfatase [Myxococcota bacterium]
MSQRTHNRSRTGRANPGRRDRPLHGIRHLRAGFAVWALSLLVASGGCWIRTFDRDKQPDLVLITVDTLRADHLDLYGHDRPTSPALTKLGREGIVFYQAMAAAPWTLPSMASIHTGTPPSVHGAVSNERAIAPGLPTVAEALHKKGYRTVAVTSHAFVGRGFGFDNGFDVFDDSHQAGHRGETSRALTTTALELLHADPDSPTFLWVHYFDPHYSYERHPEYAIAEGLRGRFGDTIDFASPDGRELHDVSRSELDYMRDVYDEEIAHTDHWIGQLVEGVRDAERDRAAIFVVTADHGEAFLEHGQLGHGRGLYDELIRVPLIIGGDIDRTIRGVGTSRAVETAAIATTLLGLAGIEENPFPSIDLVDTAMSRAAPPFAISEGSYARGSDGRKVALTQGHWKLIHDLDSDSYEFFNRRADPAERHDLADDPKSQRKLERLRAALAPHSQAVRAMESKGEAGRAEVEPDEAARLRALGYLDESPAAPSDAGGAVNAAPR